MAVRNESVRLTLEDAGFSTGMARAAAATGLLNRSLNDLDGSHTGVADSTSRTSREVGGLGQTASAAGPEIDRLSGRLRLLTDAALTLGPALVPIGAVAIPALTGLAAAAGFAVSGVGVLVGSLQGVGDALKAVNKAGLEPTEANLQAAKDAMNDLSPAAQGLVGQLNDLIPALKSVRDAGAEGAFPGISQGIESLESRLPLIEESFFAIGSALGTVGAEVGSSLSSDRWTPFLEFIRDQAPAAILQLGHIAGDLTHGLAELWMAFDPLNDSVIASLERGAQAFDDFASGLSGTEGFAEFTDYIQQMGPELGQTLAAVADAILQIVEATAPLAGPVLNIIEAFAKAIGAIADSDLGTPLFAGAAAMAALSRATQLWGTVSRTAVGQFVSGQRTAQTSIAATTTRLTTLGRGVNLAGLAKGGALLAGLGLSASGAAEGLGISNTASLALMGTIAGPWGAAIGAGAGLLLDLKTAGDGATASIKGLDAAAATGNLDVLNDTIAKAKKELDDLGDVSGFKDLFSDLGGRASLNLSGGADSARDKIAAAEAASKAMKEQQYAASSAGMAENNLAQFMDQSARAALREAGGIEESISAMRAKREEALRARDAELNYRSAILDAADAIKKNGRNLDLSTRGGIENRQVLDNLAAAWNGQSAAAKNSAGALSAARAQFVNTATSMGMTADKARALARRLFEIPEKRVTVVTLQDAASAKIGAINRELASIDRNIEVYVNIRRPNAGGLGPQVGSADGSTVPKDNKPYADRYPYMLAPGEEVISNRHGQADRHRALLKDINANRLADGGTASGSKTSGRRVNPALILPESLDVDGGLKATSRSLKRELANLERQVKKSTAAVDASADAVQNETQHRDDLVASFNTLALSIQGQFQSELFGAAGNPFASNGPTNDPISVLMADIANSQKFGGLFGGLQDRGLSGGALQAGAAGGIAGLQTLSAYNGDQLAEFQRLFDQREQMGAAVGQQVAQAQFGASLDQSNIYLETLVQQNAELIARNADLLAAQRDTKQATQAVELATKGVGSSAAKGARSKPRSRK